MRYGFKAKAEKLAATARLEIGQDALDPLDCLKYLAHRGISIIDFNDLQMPLNSRRQLLEIDPDSWSGMTIKEAGTTAIIVNPNHSKERRRNTLMHELAHTELGHIPTRVDIGVEGILLVSEYAKDDEDEADWLAGALLLPREALMACRKGGMGNAEIASLYGVSAELTIWRARMTGIDAQLRRSSTR